MTIARTPLPKQNSITTAGGGGRSGLRPRLSDITIEFAIPRWSTSSRHVTVESTRRDPVAYAVALVATTLSVAACVYYYRAHALLGYQDAYSHLEISHRLLAGRTTGIAQLGAIWLPMPHILQALFAWNHTLYVTGLAGAIISMAAFIASAVLIYRIVRMFSPDQAWPAVAAAVVFMTDANMLYQQTTAMDELPFFVFALLATESLVRWAATDRPVHLLRAAVACTFAMMCRYEGWFLAAMFAIAVLIMARRMGHTWRDVRGLTGLFAIFGVLTAAGGWLLYNWAVTGSPVNFLYGANSSADQMAKRHTDVEVGSWSKTLRAYAEVIVADHGLLLLGIAALGGLVFVARERLSARALPILALASVIPFYIATIETGQEPIGVPPVNQYLLNVRFGLFIALPAAIFIGCLLARLPKPLIVATSVLLILATATTSANAFDRHHLVTAEEASEDFNAQSIQAQTGAFLEHHTTGPIMLNLVGNERVAFTVLDRVIYEGTRSGQHNIWIQALHDPPAVDAEIVVMRTAGASGVDDVYTALYGKPIMTQYHVVYKNSDYTVYQLGR